jgi:hypothetical protein
MSRNEEKMRLRQQRERDKAPPLYKGLNRRSIGLLPGPRDVKTCFLANHGMDPKRAEQVLLAIEANQNTCCIRTSSASVKSRAAALIFRGRVLGCVYGNKSMPSQLFGPAAYEHLHRELSLRDTAFESYMIEEDIALASASMFHGTVLDSPKQNPEESFRTIHEQLKGFNHPGCALIVDENSTAIFAAYYFRGKMVAAFSYQDGWLNPTLESAWRYLRDDSRLQVLSSMLTAGSITEVGELTFSVSGLADRVFDPLQSRDSQAVSSLMLIGFANQKEKKVRAAVDINRFVPHFRTGNYKPSQNPTDEAHYRVNTLTWT